MVSEFQFLAPAWLLLLPPVWAALWYFNRHYCQSSMWRKVCDDHLLDHMWAGKAGVHRGRWLGWILAIVLTLGIVAVAAPSWRSQAHPILESTSARVIALDLSRAMLVEDVAPNRFAQATQSVRKILSTEFNGETGLVVFAGAAFVVSPLSRDANTLLAFLEALEPETMPVDGARIDLALAAARGLLEASISGRGQILLVTAGAGNPESAAQAALTAGERGHRVSVLAVGTAEGGPLKDPSGGLLRDPQGRFVLARTHVAGLQRIAELGRGRLVEAAHSSVQTELFIADFGSGIEARHREDDDGRAAANEGYWLAWLMLPFSLLLFRRNQLWILLLFLLPIDRELQAQDWEGFWNHHEHRAYRAFRQGEFFLAEELSRDPMLRGAAVYRRQQYRQALDYFSQDGSAAGYYNRGNTLARLQRFPEAVVAYRQALELDPEMESARYNKRLIEYYLERQLEQGGEDGEGEGGEGLADVSDEGDARARRGIAGMQQVNPGDNADRGSGLGVSLDPGQIDLSEQFDGSEPQLEQFPTHEVGETAPDSELIETWIKALPQASSELYRRKFLRDYQRQTRQER